MEYFFKKDYLFKKRVCSIFLIFVSLLIQYGDIISPYRNNWPEASYFSLRNDELSVGRNKALIIRLMLQNCCELNIVQCILLGLCVTMYFGPFPHRAEVEKSPLFAPKI